MAPQFWVESRCCSWGVAADDIGWDDEHEGVVVGIASYSGFQGPTTLLECAYDPISGPALHDFQLTVQDAASTSGQPVDPLPVLAVTLE